MLKSIAIKNYALIRNLNLEFPDGLTIITGQTGAGKSIMLGALSLLMGGRADTKVIADSTQKSMVEAEFQNIPEDVKKIMTEKGIENDADNNLIIRREISASGRARIFINDTPTTLQTLMMISPRLVDIHSQHANAKINDPALRLEIVDEIACNASLRAEYSELYNEYVSVRRKIKSIREAIDENKNNQEILRFRLSRLEQLSPVKGELAEIELRYEMLSDADAIRDNLSEIGALLSNPDTGALDILGAATAIAEKTNLNPFETAGSQSAGNEEGKAETLLKRLRNVISEVRDIFETVDEYSSKIDTDPATLMKLSDRMNLYYEIMKQFSAESGDELVALHENVKSELKKISTENDELPILEKRASVLASKLKKVAVSLTESRKKGAEELSSRLMNAARPLGLSNINFRAEVATGKLSSSGADSIEFLCSFNKKGVLQPLQNIASGGEMSRMMLSLKSIMADKMRLPTIIFDEVDTGVSGEIADKMGEMMRSLSRAMQVIVITHLPQVAAKGDVHFKVYKNDEEDRTVTSVISLDTEARAREIASMMSGAHLTEAALDAARTLLNDAKRK